MTVLLRHLTRALGGACACAALAVAASAQTPPSAPAAAAPHVVFVTGDDEYRSEITMPMIARILEQTYGLRTSVAYARPIPQTKDNIEGLEALETADLMVLFTRFRALPEDQLQRILAFAGSGKPIIGLRTSTHAFLYPEGHPRRALNDGFPIEVFGQKWITHHGSRSRTDVTIDGSNAPHTILNGVEPFQARSWLYHVAPLHDVDMVLLHGTSVNSSKSAEQQQTYPLMQPVAWTKVHKGAPVFFTTLGHPEDFAHASMRRLVVNAVLWALRRPVPEGGADVDVPGGYTPPETFDLSKVP
jgi:type 1 glutamine amidotransferase